ncbi:transcriptional regulator [Mailhella sp.]|uniref:transcriptional regulator n=1 Tax=Mailhella sp. TaxID=1981029 RepID=UPI004063EB52
MNPNELTAALTALQPLIESLSSLSVSGIIILLASLPVMVIAALMVLDYKHARRMERLLEAYRKDTQDSLQEVAARHAEVAEFYKKNVSLVKSYERTADALQTLVVNNTRAVERLTAIIEHRSI